MGKSEFEKGQEEANQNKGTILGELASDLTKGFSTDEFNAGHESVMKDTTNPGDTARAKDAESVTKDTAKPEDTAQANDAKK